MPYKYIFFDVAQTLLHKPAVFARMHEVLGCAGYSVDIALLKRNHKLLSEAIRFPDKTSSDFYLHFNSELLYSLGIIPEKELLESLFKSCTYLPWEKFEDTSVLNSISLRMGIISNWDNSLEEKLKQYFTVDFFRIVASQVVGVAKPSDAIYELAIRELDAEPADIVFVGDSIKLDIAPAIRAGITAVLIDRENIYPGYQGLRIKSLNELPKLIHGAG